MDRKGDDLFNIVISFFMNNPNEIQGAQLYSLIVVRVLMGWYFLYEGIIKLLNPNWSSYGFLKSSQGWLTNVFVSWADNPAAVGAINFMNVWGLIAIGLGLITGTLSRMASLSGAVLVSLYYLSYPPLIGAEQAMLTENVMWVDKNLIFIGILVVLYLFPTGHIVGLDRIMFNRK